MTSFSSSDPRRGIRRRVRRSAGACSIAALAWSGIGTTASAAPVPAVEAPLVAASLIGLRAGSQGTDVKALQQALLDAGIRVPGGADGVYGPATRQAVVDFQNARGLAPTGEVDQATSAALTAGTSGTQGSSGLSMGSQGSDVAALQEQLIASGIFLAGGADGVFGTATERAVTQFQRWNGLEATGVVNTATAKRLDAAAGGAAAKPDAVSTATSSSSDGTYVGLGRGAKGALVKQLQQALQSTGLVVRGGADGVFGTATESALKAFQRVNSFSQTGVVSERDAEVLGLGGGSTTAATSTSPYLGLKIGASGNLVKDTQQALIAAGVTVRGGADGAFGNATKTALTAYQKALGIAADGTVSQATIDKLALGNSQAPTPMPSSGSSTPATASDNPYVGLRVGSSGALVRELQQALQNTGLVVRGGADGSFGSATKSALVAFQSVNGISQTGIVSERGASILQLGSGTVGIVNPNTNGGSAQMERFPVQGLCFYGDTWGAARGGGRRHQGVDIIAAEGKLLYAVADGEISKMYWDQPGSLPGNGLRVAQPNGTYFTYLHMFGFAPGIEVGTKVKAGDVIGFVGNTGSSSTAHVHLEARPNGGAAVNPYPLVKAIDGCSNTKPQYQSSFS